MSDIKDKNLSELAKQFGNLQKRTSNLPKIIHRRASEIIPKPINWLWPARFARGKVSMIAGNPGLGKSQITAFMAAIITTGGVWPDKEKCGQGNAIILSAEDDAADTIVPRLKAVGANLDCIHIIDAVIAYDSEGNEITDQFNLATDLNSLDDLLSKITDVAAIFIDPISAYLGNTDSHKNASVRALLTPLTKLAEKYNVAVICISHLNKGGSADAMSRVTGSLAFVATSRAAFAVVKDDIDDSKRLFLPLKNNIGNDKTGLSFKIDSYELDNSIKTSRITWQNELITKTADEIMSSQFSQDDTSALDDAEEFLCAVLLNGKKPVKELKKESEDAGHSWATIRRAKNKLGVEAKKDGLKKGWVWELQLKVLKPAEDAQQNNVSTFEKFERLQKNSTDDKEVF